MAFLRFLAGRNDRRSGLDRIEPRYGDVSSGSSQIQGNDYSAGNPKPNLGPSMHPKDLRWLCFANTRPLFLTNNRTTHSPIPGLTTTGLATHRPGLTTTGSATPGLIPGLTTTGLAGTAMNAGDCPS